MSKQDVQLHVTALSSDEPARAAAAAEAIAHMGSAAQCAAVELVRACGSQDATVRAWAAAALEEIGSPTEQQIQELSQLTQDPTSDVAYWAITLLGRAGAAAAPVVETLAKILRQSAELALRERAAWALGHVGPTAATAVTALHEAAAGGPPRLARLAKAALQAITG